ncbi:MAG: hypothetical protein QXW98_07545 [Candidatus Caldarchaeum sp.]
MIHSFYYMRPTKTSKWISKIGVLQFVENEEWLWLLSRNKRTGGWELSHVYNLDITSVDDLNKILRSFFQRTSPAYILAFQLSHTIPQSNLPLLLLKLGYQPTAVSATRSSGFSKWEDSKYKDARRPHTLVVFDIQNLMRIDNILDLVEYSKSCVPFNISREELTKAEIFWLAFLDILDVVHQYLDKATFDITAASIAMHHFTAKHLVKHDIAIPMIYAVWQDLRNSVFTYPVTIYRSGKLSGTYYLCDCNNLYLYIAATRDLPGPAISHFNSPPLSSVRNLVKHYTCTAYCTVKRCHYPFPYQPQDERDVPENDQHFTWLSGDELYLAVESDALVHVHSLYVFATSKSLRSYAIEALDILRTLKLSHDRLFYYTAKFALLSMLGKFATRGYRTKYCPNIEPRAWIGYEKPIAQSDSGSTFLYAFGKTFLLEWGFPTACSAPQVFAHITANARVHMHNILSQLPKQSIIYRDVDAAILDHAGYQTLMNTPHFGTNPGQMSLRAEGDNIEIFAPRHYRIGHLEVISGKPLHPLHREFNRPTHDTRLYFDIEDCFVPRNTRLTATS